MLVCDHCVFGYLVTGDRWLPPRPMPELGRLDGMHACLGIRSTVGRKSPYVAAVEKFR